MIIDGKDSDGRVFMGSCVENPVNILTINPDRTYMLKWNWDGFVNQDSRKLVHGSIT